MNKSFVNDAFVKGINDYLNGKDNIKGVTYNSFYSIVIRLLIKIYGELDIINPYHNNDIELLKTNLEKYGYARDDANIFFMYLEAFYNLELGNKQNNAQINNPYFTIIQKMLVDMFIYKKLNFDVSEEEISDFGNLLYTPYTDNPLRVSYNFLMSTDPLDVYNYYKARIKSSYKQTIEEPKDYLNIKAYQLLNYSMNDIRNMDKDSLNKVNAKIYDYFNIRDNAINKEYLLERAIEMLERENNKVTSGNGYVDILLVLSIITTIIMVGAIVIFIVI